MDHWERDLSDELLKKIIDLLEDVNQIHDLGEYGGECFPSCEACRANEILRELRELK